MKCVASEYSHFGALSMGKAWLPARINLEGPKHSPQPEVTVVGTIAETTPRSLHR
jgi:hypothetical protein